MSIAVSRATHLSAARALLAGGRVADAEVLARSVLISDRDDPDALDLLARIRLLQNRFAEALSLLDRALRRAPTSMILHAHRAVALRGVGDPERAIRAADRALAVGGLVQAVTWNVRGLALLDLGRAAEAEGNFRDALKHQPDHRAARNNLGQALLALGRPGEAEVELRHAIDGGVPNADLMVGLGRALRGQGRLGEAATAFERALEISPKHRQAWRNLGNVRALSAAPEDAIRCYDEALAVAPDPVTESNQLHCRLYLESQSRSALRDAHHAFGTRHCAVGASDRPARPRPISPIDDRPLRVGFLSPDFARHPVGYLTVRIIEALPAAGVHAYLYSDTPLEDAMTERFRGASTRFFVARGVSDDALRAEMQRDQLDVLIDLAGHTAGNRLAMLTARIAPLQASWIGYPSTTGVPGVDLFLTDELLVPPGAEDEFTEEVCRLDGAAVTFDPPKEAPEVHPRRPGPIRFGAFHNPAKLTAATFDRYAAVLCAVPASELLFKYLGMDVPETRARLIAAMEARGVDRTRLRFAGFTPLKDALVDFAGVDIALDPTPFCGGLTSLMTLWMGVPVLTVPGETLASRQTSAYLARILRTEWIGRDEHDLIHIAKDLAGDAARLAADRAGLRAQIAASCLLDGSGTARALAGALRANLQGAATR